MKADIQSQLAQTEKESLFINLWCYLGRKTSAKRVKLLSRKRFLNHCLNQHPVKMLSETEQKSMFKFIYGEDDDQKHTSNNDLH